MNSINYLLGMVCTEACEESFEKGFSKEYNKDLYPIQYNIELIIRSDGTYEWMD